MKLKPAWRYATGGIIWRVVPASADLLIGETRDLAKKQANFFCIHRKTGATQWEQRSFGEQWWIGIEAIHNGTLLLHKFATPDMPEHRAIIAIDAATGKELWRNEEAKFERVEAERLVATRRTPTVQVQMYLDVRSGVTIPGEIGAAIRQSHGRFDQQTAHFPVQLFDVQSEDSPTNVLIREHCNRDKLVGPIECCILNRVVIFAHHERASSSNERENLNTLLTVLDRGNGTLLFTETINQHSSVVVPETFFVEQEMLFYIRDRTTLSALSLPE